MNIAAHELKSPITPIKGYLDLIVSDNKSNSNTKKWGKISLRNTERLLDLVNDILDVSRLDSDTMSFNMEKIQPINFLTETIEDVEPIIKKKKLILVKKIPNKLPYILGDKCRLEQVIKNLLGNAVKFTDKGKINIEAYEINDKILIIIEDTGIGISNYELDKIFTKFYQAYTGNDRKCEGTGLGLFISKEIIKRHNGKIWAESKIGVGTKFFIEIPITQIITNFNCGGVNIRKKCPECESKAVRIYQNKSTDGIRKWEPIAWYCTNCEYIYNVISNTLIYKIGEKGEVNNNCPKCDLKLVRVYRHINPQNGKQKWLAIGKYCKRCKYIWMEKK